MKGLIAIKKFGSWIALSLTWLVFLAIALACGPEKARIETKQAAFPEKIISLCLFIDEILLETVDHSRILSLTELSLDANISNVAKSSLGIKHHIGLNVEAILALKPDLIFVAEWSEKDKVEQLRSLGLPVVLVQTPNSFEELYQVIDQVAGLTGAYQESERVKNGVRQRLEQVEKRLSASKLHNTVSAMDYNPWSSSFGRGSSWSEMLTKAGIKNALDAYPVDSLGQVMLSKELLLQLDPDLLIIPAWIYADEDAAAGFLSQINNDQSLAGLKAVKNKAIIQMPDRLKSAVSQYMVEAVEYLAAHAYPKELGLSQAD